MLIMHGHPDRAGGFWKHGANKPGPRGEEQDGGKDWPLWVGVYLVPVHVGAIR